MRHPMEYHLRCHCAHLLRITLDGVLLSLSQWDVRSNSDGWTESRIWDVRYLLRCCGDRLHRRVGYLTHLHSTLCQLPRNIFKSRISLAIVAFTDLVSLLLSKASCPVVVSAPPLTRLCPFRAPLGHPHMPHFPIVNCRRQAVEQEVVSGPLSPVSGVIVGDFQ